MRLEVLPDPQTVASRAAEAVCAVVAAKPDAWLGLPTGSTPVPMYAELTLRISEGACDVSRATACALDEFCAASGSPGTNAAFYRQHLPSWAGDLRCPDAAKLDPADEIDEHARTIRQHGGLNLCLLGIGENGHIAFNEPGSARDSRARVVELESTTRRAHAEAFGGLEAVPQRGITLGVADLMDAHAILVLATGTHKAAVVQTAIEEPPGAALPASWLQGHHDVTWLLDEAAASLLSKEPRA
jgi:glucosamine-6-phosphate deaminase